MPEADASSARCTHALNHDCGWTRALDSGYDTGDQDGTALQVQHSTGHDPVGAPVKDPVPTVIEPEQGGPSSTTLAWTSTSWSMSAVMT